MSEPVSALQDIEFKGYAKVVELGLQGMITLRGDLSDATFQRAAQNASGTDIPRQGTIAQEGDMALAWMSPDELLLLCPYGAVSETAASLSQALSGTHHLVANVSDARARIRVAGTDAREVLGKLTPADLSPEVFGPGKFRRSRLAQVPAAFWMPDEAIIDVICFRSVARYVYDLLVNSASPGSEVGFL